MIERLDFLVWLIKQKVDPYKPAIGWGLIASLVTIAFLSMAFHVIEKCGHGPELHRVLQSIFGG